MKKITYTLLFAVLIVGSFLVGSWSNRTTAVDNDTIAKVPERQVLYYVDPMNPAHTADKPGMAPCGMPMEPVYADQHQAAGDNNMPPGTARITPDKQQLMGVRTAPVAMGSHEHRLRTLGTVAPNENLTYRITAGDKGWVWKVNKSTTGSLVKKDQLMASVYNYDFLTRQQQFLYALDFEKRRKNLKKNRAAQQQAVKASQLPTSSHGQDKSGNKHDPNSFMAQLTSYSKVPSTVGGYNPSGSVVFSIRDQLEISRLELFSLGVSDFQIDEIARKRSIANDLEIRSPVDGIVLSRNVSPQQRFNKGEEMFVVADLRQVWVLADLYEQEARYIRPGMRALVSLPKHGEVLEAKVSDVPPAFDERSHTLKVQLDIDNPGFRLRPDMFVDVEFLITLDPAITVPADAVIDSGLRKTVFIHRGEGFFEPRQVQTGWRFGDRVEITAGLMPDERIAVSGNFFIDSESRMQLAAGSLAGGHHSHGSHSGQPSGQPADKRPGHHNDHPKAMHDPGQTGDQAVQQAGHSQPSMNHDEAGVNIGRTALGSGTSVDPVCGMSVTPLHAEGAGLVSQGDGETHFFCSQSCKTQYDRTHQPQMDTPTPAARPAPVNLHDQPRQYLQQQHAPKKDIQAHTGHQGMTPVKPAAHSHHGGQAHD